MARAAQLNIRSEFARRRVGELATATGMTAAQVVEEALRAYAPESPTAPVGRLMRRGRLLVMPGGGRRRTTHKEAEEALRQTREREE